MRKKVQLISAKNVEGGKPSLRTQLNFESENVKKNVSKVTFSLRPIFFFFSYDKRQLPRNAHGKTQMHNTLEKSGFYRRYMDPACARTLSHEKYAIKRSKHPGITTST